MKIFSTKVHGILDYLMGVILLAMPVALNLDADNIQSMVFYALGGTLLFYTLLTNYELGLIKVLPMGVHLALDVLSGIFLAASPWIFGFEKQLFIPYLILGVAEVIVGLTTTSKVGVPEIQEIIATETIVPETVKDKTQTIEKPKPATSRPAATKKPTDAQAKQKPAAIKKEAPGNKKKAATANKKKPVNKK